MSEARGFSEVLVKLNLRCGWAIATALLLPLVVPLAALAELATLQGQPGSQVNVRRSPSTNAAIAHYGLGGDRVDVNDWISSTDGYIWYGVRFSGSGATGWVRGDLVRVNSSTSQRVSFAPGTAAANVGGNVQGFQVREYVLNAAAGQTISTQLIANSASLRVNVVAPTGRSLYLGGGNWSGPLPVAGDYRVRVSQFATAARRDETGEFGLTIGIR